MIFGVTNVNKVSAFSVNMTESLRVMKLYFRETAVYKSDFTVSNCVDTLHRFFVYNNKAVVCCVADYKQVVRQVFLSFHAEDFAWIFQVLRFCIFHFLRNLCFRLLLNDFI